MAINAPPATWEQSKHQQWKGVCEDICNHMGLLEDYICESLITIFIVKISFSFVVNTFKPSITWNFYMCNNLQLTQTISFNPE